MRQLIKGFKINYFIAPLLNEKNNIEIAATVDSWFYGQNPNLESHFYNEAAKNFVKNGSEGFKNSFFLAEKKRICLKASFLRMTQRVATRSLKENL